MRLKYTYSFQEYEDRYLAIVDISEIETERRLLWVNSCGKTILELLQYEITREDLINALSEKYAGDVGEIETSVDSFLKQLVKAELIIDS